MEAEETFFVFHVRVGSVLRGGSEGGGKWECAHHDGGHEEASRDDDAAQEHHEDQVGGGQDEEGAQSEVAVGALAHLKLGREPPQREDLLDGPVWLCKVSRC